MFSDAWEDIRIRLVEVEQQYNNFQIQQVQQGGHVSATDKQALGAALSELEEMLNYHLAREYGVNTTKAKEFEAWKISHQPFHWYVDFYPLMAVGGFDAVVGNPPYVEYSKVRGLYQVKGLETLESGNLYCYCIERLSALCRDSSFSGLIVPIAIGSVSDTNILRKICSDLYGSLWSSHFAIRPAKLFDGVEQRLTILIGCHGPSDGNWYTSKYHQWFSEERSELFSKIILVSMPPRLSEESPWPKIGSVTEARILEKLRIFEGSPTHLLLTDSSKWVMYFHRTPGYWIRMLDFLPFFESPAGDRSVHHIRELYATSEAARAEIAGLGSSSLYFWWFFAIGNCRNLTKGDLLGFPAPRLDAGGAVEIVRIFNELMKSYKDNSSVKSRAKARYQEFDWVAAKPSVDAMDEFFAKVFGLTDEELDFVINYDIKVRVGDVAEGI